MNRIIREFWKRRKYRLSDRGIRLDSKKSHGNTKLPFGLCKKEGIEIKPDWTPKDAWDALKGKGYVPEEEYNKLEKSKKETESVVDNTNKEFKYGREIYTNPTILIGDTTCYLFGDDITGTKYPITEFETMNDLYIFLDENGIDSIKDDKGKEYKINKKDIPKHEFKVGDQWFTSPILEKRGRNYYFSAKDMNGKDVTISESGNPILLIGTANQYGIENLKYDNETREILKGFFDQFKEGSGESFKKDGEKWVDIRIMDNRIEARNISGEYSSFTFENKNEAFKFLKDNKVTKAFVDYGTEKQDISNVEVKNKIGSNGSESVYEANVIVVPGLIDNMVVVEFDVGEDKKKRVGCKSREEADLILSYYGLNTNSKDVGIGSGVEEEFKKIAEREKILDARRRKRETIENKKTIEEQKPEYNEIETMASYETGKKTHLKNIKVIETEDGYGIIGTDGSGRTIEVMNPRYTYDTVMDKLDENNIDTYEFGEAETEDTKGTIDGEELFDIKILFKKSTEQFYISGEYIKSSYPKFRSKQMFDTEEEAAQFLKKKGINSYQDMYGDKIVNDTKFTKTKNPTFGMKHAVIKKISKDYIIFADTKRFGKHAEMFKASSEQECLNWLNENNVPTKNIKTIKQLPNSDVNRKQIGKSLSNFDNRRVEFIESNRYASNNLNSLSEEEQKEITECLTELFNNGSFRMMRGTNSFYYILQDWKFKNQFETRTSSGMLSEYTRKNVAHNLFGAEDSLEGKDREKYGYLGKEDSLDDIRKGRADWYGEINIKFKKEKLEDRVTYTFGDSIDEDVKCAGYAGSKPTIEGISEIYPDTIRELIREYKIYKAGSININKLTDMVHSISRISYIECQYHDDLTMDDVEEVVAKNEDRLQEIFMMRDEKESKMLIQKMKDAGIKFYYAEKDNEGNMNKKDAYEYLEKIWFRNN